jgi:ubiquinone/menaquinone biosynthesis C-methylase UbiE
MLDNSFDNVVSTWTLCSIANVESAISEIYRVLKPEGKFYFIEHGLSDNPNLQIWQNRLTPIQKIVGDGCHLNRNIKKLVETKFKLLTLKQFYDNSLPKFVGYMYQGIAIK